MRHFKSEPWPVLPRFEDIRSRRSSGVTCGFLRGRGFGRMLAWVVNGCMQNARLPR